MSLSNRRFESRKLHPFWRHRKCGLGPLTKARQRSSRSRSHVAPGTLFNVAEYSPPRPTRFIQQRGPQQRPCAGAGASASFGLSPILICRRGVLGLFGRDAQRGRTSGVADVRAPLMCGVIFCSAGMVLSGFKSLVFRPSARMGLRRWLLRLFHLGCALGAESQPDSPVTDGGRALATQVLPFEAITNEVREFAAHWIMSMRS